MKNIIELLNDDLCKTTLQNKHSYISGEYSDNREQEWDRAEQELKIEDGEMLLHYTWYATPLAATGEWVVADKNTGEIKRGLLNWIS